jgi:carbon storage regulator CsrA
VLVLARREGESIRIGHDITVSVLEVRWSGVIFSIDAPPQVAIITPSARNVPKKKPGARPRDTR